LALGSVRQFVCAAWGRRRLAERGPSQRSITHRTRLPAGGAFATLVAATSRLVFHALHAAAVDAAVMRKVHFGV
jgi:hypothetical protein